MGIKKAIIDSVKGGLADTWLEVYEADNMTGQTLLASGTAVRKDGRNNNTQGNSNIVSNGSIIHVYPNQMMILTDNGRIADYSAEEGTYEVYLSSAPSIFNGELLDSVKETFGRIKFAGTPSSKQNVFFINLQEIKGIKFGTANPINYFDNYYDAELFLRCHGTYSIKIKDPLKFYTECCPRNAGRVEVDDIFTQYRSEFLMALQGAINKLSADGKRISHAMSALPDLAKYLNDALDEQWLETRGFEIVSVAISNLDYTDDSKELINLRNRAAMLKDPSLRETYVQTNIAEGLKAAGSNTAGANQAYFAMGMGMQHTGANTFSQTNAQQMAAMQVSKSNTDGWKCSCGAENTGKFCSECGAQKPAPAGSWKCSCGTENTGKFCSECGAAKPSASWKCACGAENEGKFCAECGAKRP